MPPTRIVDEPSAPEHRPGTQLDRLVSRMCAAEIMATTVAFDLDTRLRSLDLLTDALPTRRQEAVGRSATAMP